MDLSKILKLPKPVAIVGIGLSGQAVYNLLIAAGIKASELATYDDRDPQAQFHDAKTLMNDFRPQTLVVSPGVPLATTWIKNFSARGGFITSELTVASYILKNEKLIGVTGALGKSTTVALLGEGAKSAGVKAFVGGNFGVPLADYALRILQNESERVEWLILELSSFQLENIDINFSLSAITFLTGNHLERYDNKSEYYDCKWSLKKRTQGVMFLNSRGGELKEYISTKSSDENIRWVERETGPFTKSELATAKLVGVHNHDNLSLAGSIAVAAGWGTSFKKGMLDFTGLPHRVQNIGTFHGIRFINDSKATTMESVKTAVQSIHEAGLNGGRIVLLLGGKDKHLPWEQLAVLKNYSDVVPVFFGECGNLVMEVTGLRGEYHPSLIGLVAELKRLARKGDTVLLSPGGTSYDEFKNFMERGDRFSAEVKRLFELQ